MGSYSEHVCDQGGKPLGLLEGPGYALPGDAVRLPEADTYGRVRLIWRCCGAFLVECMDTPDNPRAEGTHTMRVRARELAPVPWWARYSVPRVDAEWSPHLPCGDLAGEGCDCATIAAEAAAQSC